MREWKGAGGGAGAWTVEELVRLALLDWAHVRTALLSPAVNYPLDPEDDEYYEDEEEGDASEPLPPSAFKLKVGPGNGRAEGCLNLACILQPQHKRKTPFFSSSLSSSSSSSSYSSS